MTEVATPAPLLAIASGIANDVPALAALSAALGGYAPGTDRLCLTKSNALIDAGTVIIDWTTCYQTKAGTGVSVVAGAITFVEAGCYAVNVHIPSLPALGDNTKVALAQLCSTSYMDGDDTSGRLEGDSLSSNLVWNFNAGAVLQVRIAKSTQNTDITLASIICQIVRLGTLEAGDESLISGNIP